MPDVQRIQFDATIDEMVDTHVRMGRSTKTLRAVRTSYVWSSAAAAGIACAIIQVAMAHERTVTVWAVALVSGIALCVVYRCFVGFHYDWLVRRRYRRLLTERLGGAPGVHCEMELRPEGVWVAQDGVEITFHWDSATRVLDTGDAVEMGFRGGIALARNRAFATPGDRQRFLGQARTYAAPGEVARASCP
jgi:hypothetical protein